VGVYHPNNGISDPSMASEIDEYDETIRMAGEEHAGSPLWMSIEPEGPVVDSRPPFPPREASEGVLLSPFLTRLHSPNVMFRAKKTHSHRLLDRSTTSEKI